MKTVAIIPARRNSVRIPGKNWKAFHGKPIIQYSIETAQRSRLFDQIIVSTDGEEIADISKKAGAWVFERSPDDGARGTQDVAAEVLRDGRCATPSIACVIYPTAPMLTEHDLWLGYEMLIGGLATYSRAGNCLLKDIGWCYWGPAYAFGSVPILQNNSSVMVIEQGRAIDINTPNDWVVAEQMYAAWKAK